MRSTYVAKGPSPEPKGSPLGRPAAASTRYDQYWRRRSSRTRPLLPHGGFLRALPRGRACAAGAGSRRRRDRRARTRSDGRRSSRGRGPPAEARLEGLQGGDLRADGGSEGRERHRRPCDRPRRHGGDDHEEDALAREPNHLASVHSARALRAAWVDLPPAAARARGRRAARRGGRTVRANRGLAPAALEAGRHCSPKRRARAEDHGARSLVLERVLRPPALQGRKPEGFGVDEASRRRGGRRPPGYAEEEERLRAPAPIEIVDPHVVLDADAVRPEVCTQREAGAKGP